MPEEVRDALNFRSEESRYYHIAKLEIEIPFVSGKTGVDLKEQVADFFDRYFDSHPCTPYQFQILPGNRIPWPYSNDEPVYGADMTVEEALKLGTRKLTPGGHTQEQLDKLVEAVRNA